jgi:hypothetical protein
MSDLTNIEKVGGCPFCGEPPTVKKLQGCGDKHLVACRTATCTVAPTVIGATRADAIRRWNTRDAIPDRMTATEAARVLARRAAAAPSPARQAASRANGRKGGRPRRRPTTGKEGAQ